MDPDLATTQRFEKGAAPALDAALSEVLGAAASGEGRRSSVPGERASRPGDGRCSSVPGERPSRPGSQQRLGSIVADRWKLVRLVGHGAAGAVFEGVERETGARVAVKVLHDRHARSKDHVSRLMREARAVRLISHPGVVTVVDAGRDALGHAYIAFELLDGEDLFAAMERGVLTTAQTVEVGRQLLQVLGAAHQKHVLHRDVKPENIFLVATSDGSIRLKLLDFGIAKLTEGKGSVDTLDGVTLGTPYYMSPEQCRGEKLSPQADVWSVGAVLFHVFAGRPPFEEERLGRLLERIVTERPLSLGDLRPDLPPRLVSAIDRALEPSLGDRWPTAPTMAAALATYLLPLPSLDIE